MRASGIDDDGLLVEGAACPSPRPPEPHICSIHSTGAAPPLLGISADAAAVTVAVAAGPKIARIN